MAAQRRPNQFAVLEFTPDLVRLLRDQPHWLMKVAEAHRRWLLAAVHPDRRGGRPKLAREITEALEAIKDPTLCQAAIEEFLGPHEARRIGLRSEVRRLEWTLRDEREQSTRLTAEVTDLTQRLGSATGVIEVWAATLPLSEDEILVKSEGGIQRLDLTGKALVTVGKLRKVFACLFVGQRRQVLRYAEWKRADFAKALERGPLAASPETTGHAKILGSIAEEEEEWRFPRVVAPEAFAEILRRVRPYLEFGARVVSIRTSASDERELLFHPLERLEEVISGRFVPAKRKVRWLRDDRADEDPQRARRE